LSSSSGGFEYTPANTITFAMSFRQGARVDPFHVTSQDARDFWDDPDNWFVEYEKNGARKERLLTMADAVDYTVLVRSGIDPQEARSFFGAEPHDFWREATGHLVDLVGPQTYAKMMHRRQRDLHRHQPQLVAA
jgi:hypothetical protein